MTLWTLDDKEPRCLRLAGQGAISDEEVCTAAQGRFTLPVSISVHVEGRGFGDKGGVAIIQELLLLYEQRMVIVQELFLYKLKLTDAVTGPLSELIISHKGMIDAVHLSHNGITSVGAKQLCESIAPTYPIKNPDNSTVAPLWLRLEHNVIDPNAMNLAPELYIVRQNRLRKVRPPAAPLQIPHIGLPDPRARDRPNRAPATKKAPAPASSAESAAAPAPGAATVSQPKQNAHRPAQQPASGGRQQLPARQRQPQDKQTLPNERAEALYYGDQSWYQCMLGPTTQRGRMCMFVGYEQDGWQDTLAKDIRTLGDAAGSKRGGGVAKNAEQERGSKSASEAAFKTTQGPSSAATRGANKPATEGGASKTAAEGGGATVGPEGGAGARGRKATGGQGKDKAALDAATHQLAAVSLSSDVVSSGTIGNAKDVATNGKDCNDKVTKGKDMSAEADLHQAGLLLRQSYRTQKEAPSAVTNAEEARLLCLKASSAFSQLKDELNGCKCAALLGEALMRLSYLRACRLDLTNTYETFYKAAIENLRKAQVIKAQALASGAPYASTAAQHFSLSLQMVLENSHRQKGELSNRLARCLPDEALIIGAYLAAVSSSDIELDSLRNS